VLVSVDDHFYFAHRLIWVMLYGSEPGPTIDHRDGNKHNNRPDNLRAATYTQNTSNRGLSKRNKSGFKGVIWDSRKRTWRAEITVDYKCQFIGHFKTAAEAHAAWCVAARKERGEFFNAG